jgi:uncharacterized protein (TIGR02246 family)
MKRWFTVLCLATSAAVFTSCQAPATVDSRDADMRAIKDDLTQWQKDFAAKDVGKLASHYSDDVLVVNPGSQAMKGRAAGEAAYKEFVADPAFSLTFEVSRVEVAKSGDLAYAQGPYKMTLTNPATKKPFEDKGTYVEIYRKQADGSWKSAVDMGTSESFWAIAAAPAPVKE